ncbi:hypothetical protein CRUP_038440, partial [Coryphaenoides rupestris]
YPVHLSTEPAEVSAIAHRLSSCFGALGHSSVYSRSVENGARLSQRSNASPMDIRPQEQKGSDVSSENTEEQNPPPEVQPLTTNVEP